MAQDQPRWNDRPVTIHDIAAQAGVASSTVSRALNNPDRVNARTAERIRRIADDLHYSPSGQARALSSGRTRTVALLVPDITNPFYFDLIRGTQHQLKAAGYTQVLVDTEESAEAELSALDGLRTTCDGAVLTASRLTDHQIIAAASVHPLVTINRNASGVPSVLINTPTAMSQAMDHLVSWGHRRICYVSGPPNSFSNRWRWRSITQGARTLRRERSIELELSRVGPFAPNSASGAGAADAVINSGATACIAYNDLLAIGLLHRFSERRLAVPGDISVVGCDDIFGSDFCNPPLTTLTAPIEAAGRSAITMLLGLLNPGTRPTPQRRVMMPTHLTVRATTGPVTVEPGRANVPTS